MPAIPGLRLNPDTVSGVALNTLKISSQTT
jgi:hypothetical protein